jgi:hypothetical protein
MSKAIPGSSTSKPDSDAELFDKIKQCAAVWHESAEADESACACASRGDDASADTFDDLSEERCDEACELERQIWSTKVKTRAGYEAKLRSIGDAAPDAGDLILLAFMLGRDAERLGVTEAVPKAVVDLALGWFGGRGANMDAVNEHLAAMVHTYSGAESIAAR